MGTAPNNLRVSATEFLQIHSSDVAARRTRWKVPPLLPLEQKMAAETCVHIFNCGPWSHTAMSGSWGRRHIPACEKSQPFSAMAPPIPGIFGEPIPGEGSQCELRRHEGMYWAEQIIGIGKGLNVRDSLIKQGVFIGSVVGQAGFTPKKEDLEQARAVLKDYYAELMREADGAWGISEAEARSTINERHRTAAAELNKVDAPWLKNYTTTANQKCPVCGVVSDASAVMCSSSHCGYIFNEAEFARLEKRMAHRRNKQQ
jgi:hypothetical protein